MCTVILTNTVDFCVHCDFDKDCGFLCAAESNDLDARAAEVASMLAATAQQTVEEDNASEHSTITGVAFSKKYGFFSLPRQARPVGWGD